MSLNTQGIVVGVSAVIGMASAVVAADPSAASREGTVRVASPDGNVRIEVLVDPAGHLAVRVTRGGAAVLERSTIGVIVDGHDLGDGVRIGRVRPTSGDTTYPYRGPQSTARDHYRGAEIAVPCPDQAWTLQVRAYDDGAAWRCVVPAAATGGSPVPEGEHRQDGGGRQTDSTNERQRRLTGESTRFVLPAGAEVWCQDNTVAYEGFYASYTIRPAGMPRRPKRVAMPVTAELPGGGFAMISEADVVGYSGMSLTMESDGQLVSTFEDDPDGWTMTGAFASPWRVVVAVEDLDGLVGSTLIADVCPPPDPALYPQGLREPWIRPGRCLWQWWAYDGAGTKWKRQKWFVEQAAELDCDYYLVDEGWENPKFGWMDGDRTHWDRLKELCDYGRDKGVCIWVWRAWKNKPQWHWPGLDSQQRRDDFFRRCAEAGVAGVKIDFMNSESQEMLDFYRACSETAAEHKIMVNFHGANKPAGEMRTWPNEMTREGLLALEYNKWITLPRSHYTVLPFTRLAAGHADFTPTTFQPERLKGTTSAQQLACAVVLGSPVLCWADKPEVYLAQPEPVRELIRSVPTTWDETMVLPGSEIGQFAGLARRAGERWWVGLINGADSAVRYRLDLSLLPAGRYDAIVVADTGGKPHEMDARRTLLQSDQMVEVSLKGGGGYVARLRPASSANDEGHQGHKADQSDSPRSD